MYCTKKGGDRQALHEAIREHSVAAGKAIKQDGASNDLLDRIAADPIFGLTRQELDELLANSCFTGMAVEQTEDYVREVRQVLEKNKAFLEEKINANINV